MLALNRLPTRSGPFGEAAELKDLRLHDRHHACAPRAPTLGETLPTKWLPKKSRIHYALPRLRLYRRRGTTGCRVQRTAIRWNCSSQVRFRTWCLRTKSWFVCSASSTLYWLREEVGNATARQRPTRARSRVWRTLDVRMFVTGNRSRPKVDGENTVQHRSSGVYGSTASTNLWPTIRARLESARAGESPISSVSEIHGGCIAHCFETKSAEYA